MLILAYLSMILIWSTTPLAIKWSSVGLDFISGVTFRMLIGSVIAMSLCLLWHKKIPLHTAAIQVYLASAVSIYGSMMLVYWGAQFVSSGLVSVMFGLSPIFTSVFAAWLLDNDKFSFGKFVGSLVGFFGLIIIFLDQTSIGEQAIRGILAILLSVSLHAISSVWIKRLDVKLPALITTSGGLGFALPMFLLSYTLFGVNLPDNIPLQTMLSIAYLGSIGSVVGFVSYYFILTHLKASTVALATLITPIAALWLGKLFNQELISMSIWFGTALVLSGLIMHQWSKPMLDCFSKRAVTRQCP